MLHERRTKEKTLELCGDGQFSLWIYSSILLLLILFCACNSNQVKAIIQWVYSGGGAFALHAIQWIQYSGNTANGSVTWCTAHCIQLKTWKANNNGFGNNHHAQHSSLNAQTATAAKKTASKCKCGKHVVWWIYNFSSIFLNEQLYFDYLKKKLISFDSINLL